MFEEKGERICQTFKVQNTSAIARTHAITGGHVIARLGCNLGLLGLEASLSKKQNAQIKITDEQNQFAALKLKHQIVQF
eukprot:3309294-Amphidinium_carterae.1